MSPTTQRGYRLPVELATRIDKYRQQVETQTGVKVSEAAIVVALLGQALDAAEKKRRK